MSKTAVAVSGGTSIAGLSFIAGTIVSFCTTPSFVGGMGIVMSLLVGGGAFLGSTILGLAGGLAGAAAVGIVGGVVGGLVGLAFRRPIVAGLAAGTMGAAVGGICGTLGGSVYGAFKGYDMTKTALVQKVAQSPFNSVAAPANTNGLYTAPTPQQQPAAAPSGN